MAKGRKNGPTHHEYTFTSYNYNQSQQTETTDVSELAEEDVWPMVDDIVERDDDDQMQNEWNRGPNIRNQQWVSRGDAQRGGLSLAFEDTTPGRTPPARIVNVASPRSNQTHHVTSSAPVSIPNWPKYLRVNSMDSFHDSDDGTDEHDSELDRVPPHEYFAREYARSRKSTTTSVLEGVGRTLKGRDMSRVRDAVWSQTGFDG
ncbi:hypothetical protein GIB67_011486 [Kingdonia uniflora]|uniref:Senescence regulator n=1 Tax=Kingdonia uniflora TaxID=39325 RepID=A0A7J7NLI9_9MAGN|nr:hypothetical protein GIB67_011486 [Kingdonia uniflora]